jgi:hypothetical protein
MYEKPTDELIQELASLVRALDTKLNFLLEDVERIKEDVIQVKFLVENPVEAEPSKEEAEKRWKVETF